MPRRPIYKHAGIKVRVEKEKEGKTTVTLWGMRQKTNILVPLPRKVEHVLWSIISKL